VTTLKHKIKIALDESRMLILGTQIFLGFQYRAAFEASFEKLPRSSQILELPALLLLLAGVALLLSPGAYHRIVRDGSDARDVHDFATRVMDLALVPFALVLGIDVYVVMRTVVGPLTAITHGSLTGATALFFWYGFGLLLSPRKIKSRTSPRELPKRASPTELKDKIDQALTEARVVLPGAQALLGFQLLTMLMEGFDKLPAASKYVHLISLTLMALSVVLLMTPAAYHRIVEAGEDTERFHRVVSGFLLAAMVTLPLGICGDAYVVVQKVTYSVTIAVIFSIMILMLFYGLWFGFTFYRRAQIRE
jgi:hypothetical protein